MKKPYLFFISTFLFIVSISTSYCQTVDEIIEMYANAMGGTDKLMMIKTVKCSGKFSGGGADVPMTMVLKRDGKARMDMSYQGMNMTRACDETTGWVINPFAMNKEAEKMPAEDLKDMKKNAEIEGELINYKQKGYKAEFLDKDDFEGSEVYKIRLTDADGDVTYYFLDVSTYFILKKDSKRKAKEKEIKSETLYENYQKVDGVMFPMTFVFRQAGSNQQQTVTLEKVEMNTDVSDSVFKMPTK